MFSWTSMAAQTNLPLGRGRGGLAQQALELGEADIASMGRVCPVNIPCYAQKIP
jgi:hypothetical protein